MTTMLCVGSLEVIPKDDLESHRPKVANLPQGTLVCFHLPAVDDIFDSWMLAYRAKSILPEEACEHLPFYNEGIPASTNFTGSLHMLRRLC